MGVTSWSCGCSRRSHSHRPVSSHAASHPTVLLPPRRRTWAVTMSPPVYDYGSDVVSSAEVQLAWDGSSWWCLPRKGDKSSAAYRLDENLDGSSDRHLAMGTPGAHWRRRSVSEPPRGRLSAAPRIIHESPPLSSDHLSRAAHPSCPSSLTAIRCVSTWRTWR